MIIRVNGQRDQETHKCKAAVVNRSVFDLTRGTQVTVTRPTTNNELWVSFLRIDMRFIYTYFKNKHNASVDWSFVCAAGDFCCYAGVATVGFTEITDESEINTNLLLRSALIYVTVKHFYEVVILIQLNFINLNSNTNR